MTRTEKEDLISQTVRRSHCSRAGREHECVGTCTIMPGRIELSCALCGHDDGRNYTTEDLRNAEAIFRAAGIDFDVLSGEAQVRAIIAVQELIAETRKRLGIAPVVIKAEAK